MNAGKIVRGRFAPSPTGEMHLGNAWTALLAWLQVRAQQGTMVLRIEDLDPERSKTTYIDRLMDDLQWLGLDWDEGPDVGGSYGPYQQDQRRHLYQAAIDRLASKGLLYSCYCTRAELAASAPHAGDNERLYSGKCRTHPENRAMAGRKPAIRLVSSPGVIEFKDLLQGTMAQDVSRTVGDFVVQRSDGVHAYQLAVVVDDAAMHISHVLRGDDLLSSTPRQIMLYRLLDLKPPAFTHVPLLVAADGHRLSKRQQDMSISSLRCQHAGAEKIIGYLSWKAGLIDKFQPVAAHELITGFDLSCMPAGPVVIGNDISLLTANGF